MFAGFFIPLLVSSALLEARAITPQPPVAGNRDSEIIAWYSGIGKCFGYFGPGNRDLSFAPCRSWCLKEFPESDPNFIGVRYHPHPGPVSAFFHPLTSGVLQCKGPGTSTDEYPDKSLIATDEAGLEWVPGDCLCGPSFKFSDAITDATTDGFSGLDDAIHTATQSALQFLVESLRYLALASVVITGLVVSRIFRAKKTHMRGKS